MGKISKMIEDANEHINFWKKDLLMLSIGAAINVFKSEITGFMNSWTNNSLLKHFLFKAINVMLNLLLVKSKKVFKSENHLRALERLINF